jgi:hypothetical protein
MPALPCSFWPPQDLPSQGDVTVATEETKDQALQSKADTEAAVAKAAAKSKPRKGAVVVTANIDGGRRRAGRAFSRSPTTIDLADLSDEQIVAIEADPVLSVKFTD